MLEQKSVDHGFSITTAKGRTYFFHSDRADDTREWLAQLRTAVARAGKSISAATSTSHPSSGAATATASGSSKTSKPAGAPASSMDDSVGGGLLSFADLSVRNNPQTTSMTLPGSRSSALGVKPRVRNLTADFQRHRQKRPARPKVAQDQDKMAQRVYNLLYKPRYEGGGWPMENGDGLRRGALDMPGQCASVSLASTDHNVSHSPSILASPAKTCPPRRLSRA